MNTKKILVVEDEKPLAHALELKFGKLGFTVTIAGDGDEAVNILKKDKFSLVLLDIMLPKRDGFSVLEEMKKTGNKTPVIMTTNLSQNEDEKKAKDLGAVDYFVKSDTPIAEIVGKVEKFLGK